MTIRELDKRLTKVLSDFQSATGTQYSEYSSEPADKADIFQLSRLTDDALSSFKDELISYLKSKE